MSARNNYLKGNLNKNEVKASEIRRKLSLSLKNSAQKIRSRLFSNIS